MKFLQIAASFLGIGLLSGAVESASRAESLAESGPGLTGTWSVESFEITGRSISLNKAKALRFVFTEDKLTMRILENVIAETEYTTDASKDPPTMRLTYEGNPTLAIYKVEGDELQICMSGSAEVPPERFVSESGSPNRMLIVLKRGDLGPTGWPFFVVGADGSGLRQLATFPKDMAVGSPDWSPDGNKVAFDAWRLALGEDYGDAHVYVVNVDGSSLADLAVGAMPSWSPDGKRITFCQYGVNRGVWIMNADGSNPKQIDASGWGSDWSPVKNEIAYELSTGHENICVIDPDTGTRRFLLNKQRFQQVFWNMSWSPDGRQICFMGIREGDAREVAVVSAQGDEKGFRVILSQKESPQYKAMMPIVAWDGNPSQILVSMKGPGDKFRQVYVLDATGEAPPRRLEGQDADRDNGDMAWSPDGRMAVFNSKAPE
jgi:uncharacterized protein (TIGR03067 family)